MTRDTPKSRRTRQRILSEAMRLFVEIGYHRATNAAIAEAAGLTRGAMLYHFPDRDSLVAAAVERIQAERQALMDAAAADPPADQDAAGHAIEACWRLLSCAPFVAFA